MSAHPLPKMSAHGKYDMTGPKMRVHLFGNPAILNFRIRGFASPDYSGFALSELSYILSGKMIVKLVIPRGLLKQKSAHLLPKMSAFGIFIREPKMLFISSATRRSWLQDPWLCVTRLLWLCPFVSIVN
jgi:hypothetical protein